MNDYFQFRELKGHSSLIFILSPPCQVTENFPAPEIFTLFWIQFFLIWNFCEDLCSTLLNISNLLQYGDRPQSFSYQEVFKLLHNLRRELHWTNLKCFGLGKATLNTLLNIKFWSILLGWDILSSMTNCNPFPFIVTALDTGCPPISIPKRNTANLTLS